MLNPQQVEFQAGSLTDQQVLRAHSERSIEEVMHRFWFNHISTVRRQGAQTLT